MPQRDPHIDRRGACQARSPQAMSRMLQPLLSGAEQFR